MATGDTLPRSDALPAPAAVRRRHDVRPHMHEVLGLLLQAHEYALELDQDLWDLAVELPVLRNARLSNSDLRWLTGMGYVEHAIETTGPSDHSRQFRRTTLVTFTDATCVVLTRLGVSVAQEVCGSELLGDLPVPRVSSPQILVAEEPLAQPKWDYQRRQLRVGTIVVKEFKLPSPNQESVLSAFEEEGWPPRIDDPLSPLPHLDPRRRLHDTIKALNRKQKQDMIRFMGDGSGEGIRWELSEKAGGPA